ncbi:MAG: hypothetical protein BM565_07280 [Gammaproteobacteria bacterium MedPE]|nr:MAG: hypothetical protein BM565_07280 [Gammaproteobacteria bacterium MedPE]
MAGKPLKIMLMLVCFALLGGCSDPLDDAIANLTQTNESKLKTLERQLVGKQIRNATLIGEYAPILEKSRPELTPLINQLVLDSTPQGAMFQGLQKRVADSVVASNFVSKDEQAQELTNIGEALNPVLFNDALSDVVNVLADMSGGTLARVNALSQQQSQQANNSEDFGVGSQLVGNPNYGTWNNNNGMSFWEWYGMYALISNLSSPISYDRWGRYRGYSYYNDYGRYRYSSPKQRKKHSDVWNKTNKKFSTGSRYSTPYSKSRVGSSRLSRQSSQAKTAAGKGFSSNNRFKQTRSKSSYANNSSFRNSRSSTSRGSSRGK